MYVNIFLFVILFFSTSIFLFKIFGQNGLQITNFLFSFLIIFELCIRIANSEVLKIWLADLDKSLRLLVMFVIGLNLEYFFTRLTHQIIHSQGL